MKEYKFGELTKRVNNNVILNLNFLIRVFIIKRFRRRLEEIIFDVILLIMISKVFIFKLIKALFFLLNIK